MSEDFKQARERIAEVSALISNDPLPLWGATLVEFVGYSVALLAEVDRQAAELAALREALEDIAEGRWNRPRTPSTTTPQTPSPSASNNWSYMSAAQFARKALEVTHE